MSNINTQAFASIVEIQDLSNEIAATIQGGYDLQVYDGKNGTGTLLGQFNFGSDGLAAGNDRISSVRVNTGRWNFYEDKEYNILRPWAEKWTVTSPGLYNVPERLNNKISSLRRF